MNGMLETQSQSGLFVELTKSATQRDADTITHSASSKIRICLGPCGMPIPEARLRAKPSATLCVKCLEAAGDVPLVSERERRAYRGADFTHCVTDDFTDTEARIGTNGLSQAIHEQDTVLARANSERMYTYKEVKSLEAA